MKPKVSSRELTTKEDIWNAVISVISEFDFPTEKPLENEAFIVFQYYAELESGGHESLFTWFSEYIREVGISTYLNNLTEILEKIGATEYAAIEKKYGEEMWRLFITLESGAIEEEFYHVIQKADNEYYQLHDQLGGLLENYFIKIFTEFIEVVD